MAPHTGFATRLRDFATNRHQSCRLARYPSRYSMLLLSRLEQFLALAFAKQTFWGKSAHPCDAHALYAGVSAAADLGHTAHTPDTTTIDD